MQKKIIVATMISVIVILLSLGVISNLSIHDSIRHALDERAELAGLLAKYTDGLLQGNLTRLYDISLSGAIDLEDGDWGPEKNALGTAYQYSIFTDGIFLLDLRGNIVYTYPPGQMEKRNLMGIPYVRKTIEEKQAVISNIYTEESTNRKVIFVLVPLKDKDGNTIGAVGGEINPTNYILTNIIKTIPTNENTIIELVDGYGVVIASNNPVRVFTCSDRNKVLGNLIAAKKSAVMECHRCHEEDGRPAGEDLQKTKDMLAFSPLSEAPWGISVRESERMVFAPSSDLKKKFLILGIISTGTALLLALGMSRSIVNPIKSLITAANRIAEGNLKEPVKAVSRDEIGILSERFEVMRQRLSDSRDRFERYNAELESRVHERTEELQQSRRRLSLLLQKLIRAQEEERKRIARELHDETSQSIAALGMSIEIAAIALEGNELSPENISELQRKVAQLLDGISRLIQDLRPPVLDDLGFESAVRWLIERHLTEKGVRYQLHTSDSFHEFMTNGNSAVDDKALLAFFRIIQETIINIYKHAQASSVMVSLSLDNSHVTAKINDDGIGFDVQNVLRDSDPGVHSGYGLLGLRERVSLLDGTVNIRSVVGAGTHITIRIPVKSLEIQDV